MVSIAVGTGMMIVVPGVPVPKGSKHLQRRGDKVWIMDGGRGSAALKLKEWEFRVRSYAERSANANGWSVIDGPLGADVTFYMPRPKAAKNRLHCYTPPDLDKLFRGVFDPLKGILIHDDARIVSLSGRKVYCDEENPVGAVIRVWTV